MTRAARHSSIVTTTGLAGLLLLTAACSGGGQVAPPITAAEVQSGSLGYQQRLAINYYMLCDHSGDSLRCRGLHPLDTQEDGWMRYPGDFTTVSLGGLMLCGVQEGRVVCWGEDPSMEAESGSPEQALCNSHSFQGITGVRELAANDETACIVTEAGVVRCWGATLGPDFYDDPRSLDVLEGAHGVAVGSMHGCALTEDSVRCWGDPVGLPEDADLVAPLETYRVAVPDPVQVVAGDGFSCARSGDRRVFCWGYNSQGTLGRGELVDDQLHPAREIPGLRAVDLVASTDNVCARVEDGRSLCWGANTEGQLGLGHTRRVDTPTHVPALDGAVDVALAGETVCARFAEGGVRCAGNLASLLTGVSLEDLGPQQVAGVTATRLHLSERETCFSTSEGVRCVGDGGFLRRGQQEAASGWTPAGAITGDISDLSFHMRTACIRWQDGRVRCDDPRMPVDVSGTLAFAATGPNACFVDAAHRLHCWTRGTRAPAPTNLVDAASVAITLDRVCTVTTRGGVECRAWNPTLSTVASALTSSLTDVRALALGGQQTCAVRQGGQLACWDGVTPNTGEITGVTAVVYARRKMCVVQAGRVRCVRFELGVMSLEEPVPGVENVVELASGGDFLCARSANGEVRCWGRNLNSQLGVVPPTLRLAFTELSDAVVEPETPASFECQGTEEADDESEYGDEEYEEDFSGDGY